MRNRISITVAALAMTFLSQSVAKADGPFQYKPIDTEKFLVQPTDQAAGFFANASRTMSRMMANTIENNGFVRTFNNLFGTQQPAPLVQPGLSPLPPVTAFPSTQYPNSFQPRMPVMQKIRR